MDFRLRRRRIDQRDSNVRIHNSHSQRPRQGRDNDRNNFRPENFETKMAKFLKDSEDRLSSLKRSTESKRGGRGANGGNLLLTYMDVYSLA